MSAEQGGASDTLWGASHRVRWFSHQMGVNRFNCADSLDRTNVASFFVAAQVSDLGTSDELVLAKCYFLFSKWFTFLLSSFSFPH